MKALAYVFIACFVIITIAYVVKQQQANQQVRDEIAIRREAEYILAAISNKLDSMNPQPTGTSNPGTSSNTVNPGTSS